MDTGGTKINFAQVTAAPDQPDVDSTPNNGTPTTPQEDDEAAVSLTPPPDLEVTEITAPANAEAGHGFTVTYSVTNYGGTATADDFQASVSGTDVAWNTFVGFNAGTGNQGLFNSGSNNWGVGNAGDTSTGLLSGTPGSPSRMGSERNSSRPPASTANTMLPRPPRVCELLSTPTQAEKAWHKGRASARKDQRQDN